MLIGSVLVRAALARLGRVTVRGESMTPTLQPGDHLLVWRRIRPVRIGQVLVYRDRYDGGLRIKRVVAVAADGTASVRGDNLVLSTDEADLGAIAPGQMRGVAVMRRVPGRRWRRLEYHRRR